MPEASELFPSQSLEPSLGTTSRRHRVSLGRLDRFAGIAATEVRTRETPAFARQGIANQRYPAWPSTIGDEVRDRWGDPVAIGACLREFSRVRSRPAIPSSREGENKGPPCCRNALLESPQS